MGIGLATCVTIFDLLRKFHISLKTLCQIIHVPKHTIKGIGPFVFGNI